MSNKEYWYDPKHTGCLRIVDYDNMVIHGSDPKEPYWCVDFKKINGGKGLEVHFDNKKTHHGNNVLKTYYEDRNMTLHWSDGNKWRRVKQNPLILFEAMKH